MPESEKYGTRGVTIYRIGRIRILSLNEPTGLSHSQNTWTTYATLADKDKPLKEVNAVVANNSAGQQTASPLQLRINTAGSVSIYNFSLTTLQAQGNVIYIAKE